MRLITRPDFDGLVCAALLEEIGIIDEYDFVHPKDIQDGKVEVDENDVLANVPYASGCGMWFDHHFSEVERLRLDKNSGYGSMTRAYRGVTRMAPSCARVIYDYYFGPREFRKFDDKGLMQAIDKTDKADLSQDEILEPKGWILLSFIMDVRTGLGRCQDFRIDHLDLMRDMIRYCRTRSVDEILEIADVKERIERYARDGEDYQKMLKANSRADGNVIVIDFRNLKDIRVGNRFIEYALYPEQNVSVRAFWGAKGNIVFSVGHSIINRNCETDVGSLMLKYGGGGHRKAATCQIEPEQADKVLEEIIDVLKANG